MRNLLFAFLIGLMIGQVGENYYRLQLEKDMMIKWDGTTIYFNPPNDEVVFCIKNDCRKVRGWLQ